jgi:hypothetical protein
MGHLVQVVRMFTGKLVILNRRRRLNEEKDAFLLRMQGVVSLLAILSADN